MGTMLLEDDSDLTFPDLLSRRFCEPPSSSSPSSSSSMASSALLLLLLKSDGPLVSRSPSNCHARRG